MEAKHFSMRCDEDFLKAIDQIRRREIPIISMSEAIRRAVYAYAEEEQDEKRVIAGKQKL